MFATSVGPHCGDVVWLGNGTGGWPSLSFVFHSRGKWCLTGPPGGSPLVQAPCAESWTESRWHKMLLINFISCSRCCLYRTIYTQSLPVEPAGALVSTFARASKGHLCRLRYYVAGAVSGQELWAENSFPGPKNFHPK